MTTVIPVREQSGAMKPWFSRAFSSVPAAAEIQEVFTNFELAYDVRLIRSGNVTIAAEFPSEEDAVMFVLRWGR